jgi:uncharacterized membrane protein
VFKKEGRTIAKHSRLKKVGGRSKTAPKPVAKKSVQKQKPMLQVKAKSVKGKVVPRLSSTKKSVAKLPLKKKIPAKPVRVFLGKKLAKKVQVGTKKDQKKILVQEKQVAKTEKKILAKEASLESSQKNLLGQLEKDTQAIKAAEKKIEKEEAVIIKEQGILSEKTEEVMNREEEVKALEKRTVQEGQMIEQLEKKEISLSEQEMQKLKDLEKLEEQIKKDIEPTPITKITYKDVVKGLIGAFLALIGYFTLLAGSGISATLTVTRAIVLLIVSFIIGLLFLYYSGFRRVRDPKFLKIFPVRIFVIYFTALITVYIILFLYGFIGLHTPALLVFKEVAAVSLLAVIGAGAADLIGKD